jgi:hypothetical protein
MRRIVYFDRNIIGHLRDQLVCSQYNYSLIQQAVNSNLIRIPISATILEETLPVIKSKSLFKKMGDLQIIETLFDCEHWIRPHNDLLNESILAFAKKLPPPYPWMKMNISPRELIFPSPERDSRFQRIVDETELLKSNNFKNLQDWKRKFQELIAKEFSKFKPAKHYPFSDCWDRLSIQIAASEANRLGVLHECEERGINNLLNIKLVRVYVGYSISYLYSKYILGEKLLKSDSRDHQHIVQASLADIFVTNDDNFSKIIKRIPAKDFQVFIIWLRRGVSA